VFCQHLPLLISFTDCSSVYGVNVLLFLQIATSETS